MIYFYLVYAFEGYFIP